MFLAISLCFLLLGDEAKSNRRFLATLINSQNRTIGLAAVLQPEYLITSCRCIGSEINGLVKVGNPRDYSVVFVADSLEQISQVREFIPHPLCGLDVARLGLDVSLVRLASRLALTSPVKLPSSTVAGGRNFDCWLVSIDGEITEIPKAFTENRTVSPVQISPTFLECSTRKTCANRSFNACYLSASESRHFCAYPPDKDPCRIGPGSPLICGEFLFGVYVRGSSTNCRSSVINPRLFARIDASLNWMHSDADRMIINWSILGLFLLWIVSAEDSGAVPEYVAMVKKGDAFVGLGTVLADNYVVTSCRILGTENKGQVYLNDPQQYKVTVTSKDIKALEFIPHPFCGFDFNRIGYDMAVIRLEISVEKEVHAPLPSLSPFDSINYLFQISERELECTAYSHDLRPVSTSFETNDTNCSGKVFCGNDSTSCFLMLPLTVYFCIETKDPCLISPGSPFVCEGLLQGFMPRGLNCTGDGAMVNPYYFARMAYGSPWLHAVICRGSAFTSNIYVHVLLLALWMHNV